MGMSFSSWTLFEKWQGNASDVPGQAKPPRHAAPSQGGADDHQDFVFRRIDELDGIARASVLILPRDEPSRWPRER
jgi:hypothetical protein